MTSLLAKYDLTQTLIPYLDRHMVLPVLEKMCEDKNQVYKKRDLQEATLKLVSQTSMVDFGKEQYKELYNTDQVPEEFERRRLEVYEAIQQTRKDCGPLVELLNLTGDEEVQEVEAEKLRADQNFNREYLAQKYKVTAENIEALYPCAKLTYDCGRYQRAADTLFYYRKLTNNEEKANQALWGKLAAEILMINYTAVEDMKDLQEQLEKHGDKNHLMQMQQRTWLIHWSLFIFFSPLTDHLEDAVEFYFKTEIWNTIQTNCPHILRYVVVAVVCGKLSGNLKQKNLSELTKILLQERDVYSDPFTEFVLCLFHDFDFDQAQEHLDLCEKLMAHDFFLQNCEEGLFIKSARQLMFESSCQIHKRMDVDKLCARLDIKEDKEGRIVRMVQESGLEVKIDSLKNQINMSTKFPSIYTKVLDLERLKPLAHRSAQLCSQIEHKYSRLEE